MGSQSLKYYVLLHAVTLIWGSTGLMGKLVSAPSDLMVWYRVLIAGIAIAIYFLLRGVSFRLRVPIGKRIVATGLLVGAHWMLFFESVKQSTVSVTMVCLAMGPFFVAISGALLERRRIHVHELLLGLSSAVGVGFVLHFEFEHLLGVVLGVCAAMLSSLFFALNSQYLQRGGDPVRITFYEMIGAFGGLTLYGLVLRGASPDAWGVTQSDLGWLLYLGVVCTALAFIAGVAVMRVLSAFTTMMTINLEPIYGILLALAVLGDDEYMSPGFYFGAGIIVTGIFIDGAFKRRLALAELIR